MYSIFKYLRFGRGLRPEAPLGDDFGIRIRVVREGYLPSLGCLRLWVFGGRSFLLPPLKGRIAFCLLLLLFVFISLVGGESFRISGHRIRSTFMEEATFSLLALLLGLLLRRLVRRRNQHLR